ncbi:methyltransferase [Thalassotalea sp. PP2-459]|nr:methyltransferase [Thalassotalea sp. PP2-459]
MFFKEVTLFLTEVEQNITAADFSQCQRLFHGRGHAFENFEHVNVDWLAPVVLITLYQTVDDVWLHETADMLLNRVPLCRSVQVQRRYLAKAPTEVLLGETISETEVTEHDLHYHIQLGKSQNIGLFLDMANGRQWVQAHAEGKKVLNLFAYTCAFSVAAVAGGASKVVNIDMAKGALAKGRDNHRLNQHDLSKVIFEGVDIFKSYNRLKKYGPYQLMICDPPSFQKGSVNIARDYKKILSRIPQLLSPEAELLLCLNSPDLDEQFLLEEMKRECPDCQFIEKVLNPAVFKEATAGKGLKALKFKYLPL